MFVHVGGETSEIDLCLDIEQGLCHTAERLLMIIHEFCSIYLECEHVHESHSCTVSSAAQLMCDLHQIMDRREREEVSDFLSQYPSVLLMLLLAVSRHRKCKLQVHCLFGHKIILSAQILKGILELKSTCSNIQLCVIQKPHRTMYVKIHNLRCRSLSKLGLYPGVVFKPSALSKLGVVFKSSLLHQITWLFKYIIIAMQI